MPKNVLLTPEQWRSIENHIATHNEEMGVVKTDIKWLKWMMKTSVGATIASFISGVFAFVFR